MLIVEVEVGANYRRAATNICNSYQWHVGQGHMGINGYGATALCPPVIDLNRA